MSNVVPLPKKTIFANPRDKRITPEQVVSFFAEAATVSKRGLKVPDVARCRMLADTLTLQYFNVAPNVAVLDLPNRAGLEALLPAFMKHVQAFESLAAVSPSDEATTQLELMNMWVQVTSLILNNAAPVTPTSWHEDARRVASLAQAAWASTGCKAPEDRGAEGPLVAFVGRCLAATGRSYSFDAVSAALRGKRGRK